MFKFEQEQDPLKDPNEIVNFSKTTFCEGLEINDVKFESIKEAPEFANIPDVDLKNQEPEFKLPPNSYLKKSTGVIIEEPDGRIWIYEPSNHFGGYEHTFPKGRIEPTLTLQQTAVKEALEETGLLTEITGYLGDYTKTTTLTRYYLAKRIGGTPTQADFHRKDGEVEEVWTVSLVPKKDLKKLLNMPIDQKIADDIIHKLDKSANS